MSRTAVLTLAAVVMAGADAPPPAAPAPDGAREALQGSWTLTSFVVEGDGAGHDHVGSGRLVVEGDRYAPRFGTDAVPARYALDPARSPKAIDFTFLEGPQCGKTVKGIYAVEGDTLTICRALGAGEPRPDGFGAGVRSRRVLLVWRRAGRPSGEAARDLDRLQGAWRMVAATTDGMAVDGGTARKVTVTVVGTTHSVRIGGTVVAHDMGFEIDPTTSPRSVTDTVLDGPGKGTTVRGIYRVEGDTLTSCLAHPGHDRPTAFEAGPGTGRTLRVFRRDPAATKPGAAEGREHLRFEGVWAYVSLAVDGTPAPAATLRDARLTLRGNRFVSVNARGTFHGTYAVDVDASPKTIDVTVTGGPESGHTLKGVYELDGDGYRCCLAPPGAPRPASLDAAPGRGHTLGVLKRVLH